MDIWPCRHTIAGAVAAQRAVISLQFLLQQQQWGLPHRDGVDDPFRQQSDEQRHSCQPQEGAGLQSAATSSTVGMSMLATMPDYMPEVTYLKHDI